MGERIAVVLSGHGALNRSQALKRDKRGAVGWFHVALFLILLLEPPWSWAIQSNVYCF